MNERLCQTGNCIWLNGKVPSAHAGWMRQCPIIAVKMMEISPEMDLKPDECPPAVGYAYADAQLATTQGLEERSTN